jgi:hypothetical protein
MSAPRRTETFLIPAELRDELLHGLDNAIELADQTGRSVLAADLRRLFDQLLASAESGT